MDGKKFAGFGSGACGKCALKYYGKESKARIFGLLRSKDQKRTCDKMWELGRKKEEKSHKNYNKPNKFERRKVYRNYP